MECDRGDRFPFDFEPNGKENGQHDHIPFNLKGNGTIFSKCTKFRCSERIVFQALTIQGPGP